MSSSSRSSSPPRTGTQDGNDQDAAQLVETTPTAASISETVTDDQLAAPSHMTHTAPDADADAHASKSVSSENDNAESALRSKSNSRITGSAHSSLSRSGSASVSASTAKGDLDCKGSRAELSDTFMGDDKRNDDIHNGGKIPLCQSERKVSAVSIVDIAPAPVKTWSQRTPAEKREYVWQCVWKTLAVVGLLYVFLIGLSLLSKSFKVLAGPTAGKMFTFVKLPMSGLMVGMLLTVVLQSSSTTTSLTVGLVASGQLTVRHAIPVIMGANIGTSVTNTIVSLAHLRVPEEFERAFSGATVHDFFNILAVAVLMPFELVVHPIEKLSEVLVSPMTGASTFPSPIKAVVDPVAKLFIKPDSCISKTLGVHPLDREGGLDFFRNCVSKCGAKLCPTGMPSVVTSLDQVAECPKCGPDSFTLVAGGMFKGSSVSDTWVGIIGVLIALVLVVTALCLLVKVLAIVLKGRASKWFRKSLDLNPYLAMLVGCGITVLVQSSSITTSTLVPLVGHGAITLEQMFPTTLGANVGTTFTGLLAASALDEPAAIQIALCHMFFNIIGIVLFYPIPWIRAGPLECARSLGYQVRRRRWVAPVYMLSVFLVVPLTLMGLSISGTGGLIVGAVLLYGAAVIAFAWRQVRIRRPDLIPPWVPNVLRPNDRESGPSRNFPHLSRVESSKTGGVSAEPSLGNGSDGHGSEEKTGGGKDNSDGDNENDNDGDRAMNDMSGQLLQDTEGVHLDLENGGGSSVQLLAMRSDRQTS